MSFLSPYQQHQSTEGKAIIIIIVIDTLHYIDISNNFVLNSHNKMFVPSV